MLLIYKQNIHIQPHNEMKTERGESERANSRFTWAETLQAATFGHSCIFTYEPSSLSHPVIMITGLCCYCCRPLIWIPLHQNKQALKKKKSLSTWLYSNQQITQPREDSKQYLLDGCALPSTLHGTLSSLCSCKQLYAASNTTRITEHTLNIYSDLFCCHTACMYINQRGQHLIFTVYSNCVLLRRLGCFILSYLSFCPHRGTLSCHFP